MKSRSESRAGLVTVTFRQLSPEKIVETAKLAGLEVLERGGDVHVPAGDTRRAREVAVLTQEAGLQTVGYGSYYRVGPAGEKGGATNPGGGRRREDMEFKNIHDVIKLIHCQLPVAS